MSYKPDEATLTSYLYGELSAEELAKVDAYIKAHPEIKKELEEIQSAQGLMGKLRDTEVNAPSFVFEDSTKILVPGRSSHSFIRSALAVAASISLIVLVGYFTQLKISNQNDGWKVGFGSKEEPVNGNNGFNEEKIKQWMQQTLAANNDDLIQRINDVKNDLGAQKEWLATTKSSMQPTIDQDVLDRYVNQLANENRDIILNLLEVSGQTQRKYMDEMLVDFANFIEAQRQSDLEVIQQNFNTLVSNSGGQMDNYRNSE